MSKKPHSGLKRALAWMLTVAMMAQGLHRICGRLHQ